VLDRSEPRESFDAFTQRGFAPAATG
jgi:hypothetical protein